MSPAKFPELPPAIAGWKWASAPGGDVALTHPDGAYTTKGFAQAKRAISDALRWQAAQPGAPAGTGKAFAADVLAEYEARHAVAARPVPLVFKRPAHIPERLLVPPQQLVEGRWQPRQAMEEQALLELLDSIVEHGVLEDLIAVVNERGELELVTGHRRRAAALRIPSRPAVPVKVLDGITLAQATEIAVISNDQRSDLTDVERGQAYERMIAEQGISEAELARRLARPRAYIQQRRAVASASPELQRALAAGELSFTHGRAICEGSGGDHAAQAAVVKESLRRIKQGSSVRSEDLKGDTERQVLKQAEDSLKRLGWKMHSTWLSGSARTYFFASTAQPAEWSPAEILATVRAARRPPDTAPTIAQFGKEDVETLSRRGLRVETSFAPWPAVESPDGKRYLFGDEAAAALVTARAELAKLTERFEAAGWAVTWKQARLHVSTGTGKQKCEETPWSWSDAQKLIGSIEKGAYSPNKGGRERSFTCPRCKAKATGGEYRQFGGEWQTVCMDCSKALAEEEAAQQRALAAALEAELGAWLDAAPPAALALIVSEAFRVQDLGERKGWRSRAKDALASTAWRYREQLRQIGVTFAGETGHAVAAPPAELVETPAIGFARIGSWLDELQAAWDAGTVGEGDEHTLETIAGHLEDLTDDQSIPDADYEEMEHRLNVMAEQLGQLLEVRSAA